jgi:hypothetical protein
MFRPAKWLVFSFLRVCIKLQNSVQLITRVNIVTSVSGLLFVFVNL